MYAPLQKMGKYSVFMKQTSINAGRPISEKNIILELGNLS